MRDNIEGPQPGGEAGCHASTPSSSVTGPEASPTRALRYGPPATLLDLEAPFPRYRHRPSSGRHMPSPPWRRPAPCPDSEHGGGKRRSLSSAFANARLLPPPLPPRCTSCNCPAGPNSRATIQPTPRARRRLACRSTRPATPILIVHCELRRRMHLYGSCRLSALAQELSRSGSGILHQLDETTSRLRMRGHAYLLSRWETSSYSVCNSECTLRRCEQPAQTTAAAAGLPSYNAVAWCQA
jgi:hypothetical protein